MCVDRVLSLLIDWIGERQVQMGSNIWHLNLISYAYISILLQSHMSTNVLYDILFKCIVNGMTSNKRWPRSVCGKNKFQWVAPFLLIQTKRRRNLLLTEIKGKRRYLLWKFRRVDRFFRHFLCSKTFWHTFRCLPYRKYHW